MRTITIAAIITIGLSLICRADPRNDSFDLHHSLSSGFWFAACQPEASEYSKGMCDGQLTAIFAFTYMKGLSSNFRSCPPPDGISIHAVKVIVLDYIKSNDVSEVPFLLSTTSALQKAWPCKK